MKPAQLVPALIVPLIAWRIYARVRHNIGRQPIQPKRMIARIIILSGVTLIIGVAAITHPPTLAGLAGGLLLGVPLAFLGLRLTQFEITPTGKFYTPNTAIGVTLSVLFVGRIVYRIIVLSTTSAERDPSLPQFFQSPLTLLVFGVTAGYYIAYYSGLLRKGRGEGSKDPRGKPQALTKHVAGEGARAPVILLWSHGALAVVFSSSKPKQASGY